MTEAKVCPSCATPLPDEAAFCFMCGAATPLAIDQATGEAQVAPAGQLPERDLDRLARALGSHYELGPVIGRGGFAEVFLLHDRRLKRDLALKAMRPELAVSEQLIARFRREAETVAALRHPHIVPIYDIGEADGLMYIIMPLIQGESLKSLLLRDGPRPPREAMRILVEAAEALGAAHEAGVVHRDVKPENIMLEGRGRRVQLMDFGIAKALDAKDGGGLTSTGLLVGTPHYMSPEQASGETNLDHRSDQYSLAVVGYQMVTGQLPFEGETTRAVLFQQMVGTPKSLRDLLPDVPAALAFTIERALAKEPAARYPSMEAFAAAIRGPESWPFAPEAQPPTQAVATRPTRPGRRWLPIAGAGLAALVLVAVATQLSRSGQAGSSGPAAADSGGAAGPPTPATAPAVRSDSAPRPQAGPATPPAAEARSLAQRTPTQDARPARSPATAPPPAEPTTCSAAVRAEAWSLAATLCQREAESGSPSASRLLASLHQRGSGLPRSDSAATYWYRRAADAGDAESAYRLGIMLAGMPGNPARDADATSLLRRAADAAIAEAWPILAERYEQGLGTKRNDQEAAFWYRKAAERANAGAQYNLGMMYARGRGVKKDEVEAAVWFGRAADQGNSAAQYEVGMAYLRGRGVGKSDSLGLVWIERAAKQGHPEATKELERRQRP